MDQIWLWVGFNVFVLLMLAADLGIFHRKAHEVSVKEAAGWSVVWVALALLFNFGVYQFMEPTGSTVSRWLTGLRSITSPAFRCPRLGLSSRRSKAMPIICRPQLRPSPAQRRSGVLPEESRANGPLW